MLTPNQELLLHVMYSLSGLMKVLLQSKETFAQ